MFDFIHKHKKIMQILLFILIVPSFALVGVDGYNRMLDSGANVAKVAGVSIKQTTWDNAVKNDIDRIRASNLSLDVKLLDTPEFKMGVLDRLVREQVTIAAVSDARLETSDQRLASELQNDPAIAALRGPDGKLDNEKYKQLVGSQGLTPAGFEARFRNQLSMQQVFKGLQDSSFAPNALVDVTLNAFLQKREIQVANFDAATYASKVNLTDADLETYYKANASQFQAPEQANIEYVVLDVEALKNSITVSDADLKSYYDQNAGRYASPEERRASHVLINAPKSAPAADRAAAKSKAQALLESLKKAPNTFAEVAKANSQDPGSAANGGDLSFFAKGAMVKPFEDAAFALKKDELSGVVESDFGYHIIKLTDIKPGKQRSFEEVKGEITAEVKKQQAQKKYAEAADIFTNTTYEQSDSLKPVADKLKLEIKTASNVTRSPTAGTANASNVLATPKFLNALFSADSIEKKRNTEAVETPTKQLISGRITQYTAARTLPLADVKDRVRARLTAQISFELAKKEGVAQLAAWKAAPAKATLPAAVVVSRQQGQSFAPQVIEAVLKADSSKLPEFVGVEVADRGYYVAKINKVLAPEAANPAQAQVLAQGRSQYAQALTAAEDQAYYKVLKARFKTDVKVDQSKLSAVPNASDAAK
ncbi:MAG TPA: SurA N-terminal domain-containing protein [Burkholderiaceae bacterium]|nr:SurA N-terminal domain-containing protein [Burkholderiaceae bacterium]